MTEKNAAVMPVPPPGPLSEDFEDDEQLRDTHTPGSAEGDLETIEEDLEIQARKEEKNERNGVRAP